MLGSVLFFQLKSSSTILKTELAETSYRWLTGCNRIICYLFLIAGMHDTVCWAEGTVDDVTRLPKYSGHNIYSIIIRA